MQTFYVGIHVPTDNYFVVITLISNAQRNAL